MDLRLDPESPIPLYHQIAEAIRYRIATGAIRAGSPLPALRDAAKLWKVNLHTVRRAYGELAKQGIVVTAAAQGTRVAGSPSPGAEPLPAADRFVARVMREAREKYGLGREELIARLRSPQPGQATAPRVSVVECSETQCTDLAQQIAARWRVEALPWPLDKGEPAGGPIIATYFHYNDVRRLWPGRLADIAFIAIGPDPALTDSLRSEQRRRGKRMRLLLCESETVMAANIAADLGRVLPARDFEIAVHVARHPEACLSRREGRAPVLFSPRVWGRLTPAQRAAGRAREVRYVIEPAELDAVAAKLGWNSR